MNRTFWEKIKPAMVVTTFGVLLFWLLLNLGAVSSRLSGGVVPILMGLSLAFLVNIPLRGVERLLGKLRLLGKRPGALRAVSIVATLLLIVLFLSVVMLVIVPETGRAISTLASGLPSSTAEFTEWLSDLLIRVGVGEEIVGQITARIARAVREFATFLQDNLHVLTDTVVGAAVSVVGTIANVLFALLIALYVLADKARISGFARRVLEKLLPAALCEKVLHVSRVSYRAFSQFFVGQFVEAIILGGLCFVGLLLLRMPYAVPIAMLIGITALIPIVGAWIGVILSMLLVASVSPVKALVLAAFVIVLQQVEGNLIYPRTMGTRIGLPGMLVLCAVLLGQSIGGIVGILLAVPVASVLYALVKEWLGEGAASGADKKRGER